MSVTEPGPYHSASQRRVVSAIEDLASRPLVEVDAAALAARIGCSRDQAYRVLRNLEAAGWALAGSGGGWRISPRATLLAESIRAAFAAELRAYLGPSA